MDVTDIRTQTFDIGPYGVDDRHEVWAIGDVHGRADLLEPLLDLIESTPHAPDAWTRNVLQLGDVIDRGPESLRAIDLLIEHDVTAILGNHEAMALAAAATRERRWHSTGDYALWSANGGQDTLRDGGGDDYGYGLHPTRIPQIIGLARWDYIRTAHTSWASGDVLFVHAGLDPSVDAGVALSEQWDSPHDDHYLWIRERFLDDPRTDAPSFVTHGHTWPDAIARRGADTVSRNRLNLDGGSYVTGIVRAARFVGSSVTVYDSIGDYDEVRYGDIARRARAGL